MKTKFKLPALVLLAIVLSVMAACNTACLTGSGTTTAEIHHVDAFTEIETSGTIQLMLTQTPDQMVTVVTDDNVQKYVKTTVRGDKLKIELEGDFCDIEPVQVFVNAKVFNGLAASGAVQVTSKGRINTTDFYLDLSGANKVTLDLSASKVKTQSSGSSEINLKGQTGEHDVDLSGASQLNAFDFVTGNYTINSSGAGKCYINVLNRLDVTSSGASQIEYRGNPTSVKNDDSGASSLKKVGM